MTLFAAPEQKGLSDLKGIGPERARRLHESLGIRTVRDLLFVFPRTYLDRSRIDPIGGLQPGRRVVIGGTIEKVAVFRSRIFITTAYVKDDTATVRCLWFNQPYLKKTLKEGDRILVAGDVSGARGIQIHVRDYEIVRDDDPIHFGKLIPIYPSMEGVQRKVLRRAVHEALAEFADRVPETLPGDILARHDLLSLPAALKAVHFPEDVDVFGRARRRLAFDELFLLQVALSLSRMERDKVRIPRPIKLWKALDLRIRGLIPFKLTAAQNRVVAEILADMQSDRPMNRLLQGDVGSGKTVVALMAALVAIGNRRQACLMAPTEVLAVQHARSIARILGDAKVNIALLAGPVLKSPKHKRPLLDALASGEVDLVVGTHALLEPGVLFKDLGLAVIDEQHKFGVQQRAALLAKGAGVHALVMTATPIPRTLTIAAYGDLDVSVIDELPPGRRPPRTYLRPESRLPQVIDFIRKKLKEGRQAYFVFPIVEDSERLRQLQSATRMHAKIRAELEGRRVELLHGRMKSEEKDEIMRAFRAGDIHVLVSTIVIEVGVDVPNATVMVIGHAERYGLSQLHQLRGRIGRGSHESVCLLLGNPQTEEARRRLQAMLATTDGFKIAEEDLAIRGPGEFLGTRQSGLPEFRVASLPADMPLLSLARREAQALVRKDPGLGSLADSPLMEELRVLYGRRLSMGRIG